MPNTELRAELRRGIARLFWIWHVFHRPGPLKRFDTRRTFGRFDDHIHLTHGQEPAIQETQQPERCKDDAAEIQKPQHRQSTGNRTMFYKPAAAIAVISHAQ